MWIELMIGGGIFLGGWFAKQYWDEMSDQREIRLNRIKGFSKILRAEKIRMLRRVHEK